MVLALTFVILGGCQRFVDVPGPYSRSEVLNVMSEVTNYDPHYYTWEETFRIGLLRFLNGLTREEALARLSADGFACDGAACEIRTVSVETWAAPLTIRAPGPLQKYTLVYRVTVVGAAIRGPDDLSTSVDEIVTLRYDNG